MDFYVPVRHTDFCVYVEGRNKEGGQGRKEIILVNYLLQIPFLCICSPEFLIHPWPFMVSSLWNSLLVFEFSESLSLCCVLVSLFLFSFCLEGTSYAISFLYWLSIFFHLVFDPPASISVANGGLIASLQCCFSWLTDTPMHLFTTLSLSFNLLQDFVILCLDYHKYSSECWGACVCLNDGLLGM